MRLYRDKSMCEGPFTIPKICSKEMWVTDGRKVKHFNCTQVLSDPTYRADREMVRLLEGFGEFNTGYISDIMVTEVLHPSSKLREDPGFTRPN